MSARVSVLLPAFDAAETVGACLRSLVRQTLDDWECVFVDDGSRDGTLRVARRAVGSDPRFRFLERGHEGLVGALRTGLAACRGRYVARMDADDVAHRDRFRLQIAALERNPTWAACGTHVRIFPRAGLGKGRREYERWLGSLGSATDVRRDRFVECPVAHPTIVARRDVLDEAGGYHDDGLPEDYDLVLRLLESGHDVGVVARRLLLWRDHDRRLSRTSPVYAQERFVALKARFLARGFLARSDDYVLCGYGSTGKALRRALAAHGKHPKTIVDIDPRRIGRNSEGSPIIPPEAFRPTAARPLLVSVARAPGRTRARRWLDSLGLVDGRDYLCTA